jgi:hypothetical protein
MNPCNALQEDDWAPMPFLEDATPSQISEGHEEDDDDSSSSSFIPVLEGIIVDTQASQGQGRVGTFESISLSYTTAGDDEESQRTYDKYNTKTPASDPRTPALDQVEEEIENSEQGDERSGNEQEQYNSMQSEEDYDEVQPDGVVPVCLTTMPSPQQQIENQFQQVSEFANIAGASAVEAGQQFSSYLRRGFEIGLSGMKTHLEAIEDAVQKQLEESSNEAPRTNIPVVEGQDCQPEEHTGETGRQLDQEEKREEDEDHPPTMREVSADSAATEPVHKYKMSFEDSTVSSMGDTFHEYIKPRIENNMKKEARVSSSPSPEKASSKEQPIESAAAATRLDKDNKTSSSSNKKTRFAVAKKTPVPVAAVAKKSPVPVATTTKKNTSGFFHRKQSSKKSSTRGLQQTRSRALVATPTPITISRGRSKSQSRVKNNNNARSKSRTRSRSRPQKVETASSSRNSPTNLGIEAVPGGAGGFLIVKGAECAVPSTPKGLRPKAPVRSKSSTKAKASSSGRTAPTTKPTTTTPTPKKSSILSRWGTKHTAPTSTAGSSSASKRPQAAVKKQSMPPKTTSSKQQKSAALPTATASSKSNNTKTRQKQSLLQKGEPAISPNDMNEMMDAITKFKMTAKKLGVAKEDLLLAMSFGTLQDDAVAAAANENTVAAE